LKIFKKYFQKKKEEEKEPAKSEILKFIKFRLSPINEL